MRKIIVVTSLSIVFLSGVSFATSPPFRTVTIMGKTDTIYNKVSLFDGGPSKKPLKTAYISDRDRTYRIDVRIPDDMRKKDNYLYADMRFWEDKNADGIKDPGEPISEGHFIIWVPSGQIVYMQVYKGPKYRFKSSTMAYDYK